MKKINFLLSCSMVAALALTSCSLNEDVNKLPEETPIAFDTYVGRDAQTKGHVETLDGVKIHGFGVFAYYDAPLDDPKNAYNKADFMYNQMVSWDNTLSTPAWTYSPLKYWPKQGDLDFLAYAPYGDTHITLPAKEAISPVATFAVDATVANQVDFLVAGAKEGLAYVKPASPVEFTFGHVLSKIQFYAKSGVAEDGIKIYVNSIVLKGDFYAEREINLSNSTWQHKTVASGSYTLTQGTDFVSTVDAPLPSAGFQALNKDKKGYLFLIPDGLAKQITINYTIKQHDADPITLEETIDISQTLAKGTAYKFQLTFSLEPIVFDAKVTDWATETEVNGTVNA